MIGEQVAFQSALTQQASGFELNDLVEAPIATLGDIITSTVNSITFGATELETDSFLAGLGFEDSAEFYTQHQDAVEVASFIGGLALPLGAALKGLQMAKAGKLLAPRWNKFQQWEDKIKLSRDSSQQLLKNGDEFTEAFRAEQWNRRALVAKSELAQSAVAEATVLWALNDHPWMQDYDAYTFALGTGLGALAVPFRLAHESEQARAGALKLFTEETKALQKAAPLSFAAAVPARTGDKARVTAPMFDRQGNLLPKSQLTDPAEAFPVSEQVVQRMANMERQDALLGTDLSPLAKAEVERYQLTETKSIIDNIRQLLSPSLATRAKQKRIQLNKQNLKDALYGSDEWATEATNHVARFLRDSKAGLRGVRAIHEIPPKSMAKITDDFVVLDPFFNRVIAGGAAQRVMRHADVSQKIGRRTSKDQWVADYSSYTRDSVTADRAFLEAAANYDQGILPIVTKNTAVPEEIADLPRLQAAALAGKQVNWNGTVVTAADKLAEVKVHEIQKLAKAKHGAEEIAIKTNTPLHLVEQVQAANFNPSALAGKAPVELSVYTSLGQGANKYLGQRKLLLVGEKLKPPQVMQPIVALDRQTINQMNDAYVEKQLINLPESNADIDTFVQEVVLSDTMRQIRDDVHALGAPAQGSPGIFTSADFALRNTAELGQKITSLGTQVAKFLEKVSNEQVSKVSQIAARVKADPVDTAQFAQVFQQWHSLPNIPQRAFFDAAEGRFVLREADPSGAIPRQYLTDDNGAPITVRRGSALHSMFDTMFNNLDGPISHLRQVRNASRAVEGRRLIQNEVHFPYASTNDKFVGYVIDEARPDQTRAFIARNAAELDRMVKDYTTKYGSTKQVVRMGDPAWAHAHQYAKVRGVPALADPQNFRTGTGILTNPADPTIIDEFLSSLSADVYQGYRALLETGQNEVFSRLDDISTKLNAAKASAVKPGKALPSQRNLATIAKASLLNTRGLEEVPWFSKANDNFSFAFNLALDKSRAALTAFKGAPTREQYNDYLNQLSRSGVISPSGMPSFMEWARANTSHYGKGADDFIGAASALTTAFALKIGEVAHAAATVFSAPVLMGGEAVNQGAPYIDVYRGLGRLMKATFDDASPEAAILARAKEKGFVSAEVAELTRNMAKLHASPGKVDKFLESKIVRTLSLPTEKTEGMVREWAYMTGYEIAKKKYPAASEEVLEHYANAFTKRTQGNYTSGQRPVVFQGALGHTLGLFQTYMATFAQNGMRYLGEGDRKAMAALLMNQIGVFGFSSLPGYDFLNQNIANHVFEDKMSLENAALRFGNSHLAEIALYGLPSWMSQLSLTTRGDMDFRGPLAFNTETGFSYGPAILDTAIQATQFVGDVAGNLATAWKSQGGPLDYGKAVTQAIGVQGMNRPLARMAELVQGYSTNRSGRVVDLTENYGIDELSDLTLYTKLIGTRPLKEHIVRQANYMNSFYHASDRAARESASNALKLYATGTTDFKLGAIMNNYMETGGSGTGFKSMLNTSYLERQGLEDALARDPDYPAIQDILTGFYLQ